MIEKQMMKHRSEKITRTGEWHYHLRQATLAASLAIATAAGTLALAQKSSASAAAQFGAVESLIQQGHLDEAKAMLAAQLKQSPASVEGLNLLGIIDSEQSDPTDALAAFEKARKLSPKSTKTLNNLGHFYLSQKKPELAETEFRSTLCIDPANADANYALGVLLLSRNSATEAIPHLARVRSTNQGAAFHLVRAYFQAKRTEDALRLAAQISDENKTVVQVHFSLGVLLASQKQYKQASLEFEKAEALAPNSFEILFNNGEALFRSGNLSQAELALNRALSLRPDSPETQYLLASVYRDESRPLDALNLLIKAHKAAPDNTDIILLMAQISMSQEYYEDAIPLLESGVKSAPRRADLHSALGESYFMAGKVDKSLDEFKRLIELDPSARSYAFVAFTYRNLGRYDDARKFVMEGLKRDVHNTACLLNLGFIEESQGNRAAAEAAFEQILRASPKNPDALLELANLRVTSKRYAEAADLLKRYVVVSRDPANGYYKLAMVERSLHQTADADRDLKEFQSRSKNRSSGPLPFQHLFENVDTRTNMDIGKRNELDIADLQDQVKKHPDQTEDLYLLIEAYLKAGQNEQAASAVAQLNQISTEDYRTLTAVGVLLSRFHLYEAAIQQFQAALKVNPSSDEIRFNLANALFKHRQYDQALQAATSVSEDGRKDNAYLALLGDIYAHLGQTEQAEKIYEDAVKRNPDDDQNYLSIALLDLRNNDAAAARQILTKAQSRLPGSGKLFWGLGLTSVVEGKTAQATGELEKAVDLLPEWPGSYSVLGVFYYQTGQIDKAKEVLDRFKNSAAGGTLNADRIAQLLASSPAVAPAPAAPLSTAGRAQLLQLALSVADRTL